MASLPERVRPSRSCPNRVRGELGPPPQPPPRRGEGAERAAPPGARSSYLTPGGTGRFFWLLSLGQQRKVTRTPTGDRKPRKRAKSPRPQKATGKNGARRYRPTRS